MTQQIIYTGLANNDHRGETLRSAFIKANSNFTELYSIASNTSNTLNAAFAQANAGGNNVVTTVAVNAGSNTGNIAIDLTKQVNRIYPYDSKVGNQYTLADGVEGQIIYLVPHNAYTSVGGNVEYTTVSVSNARYRDVGTGDFIEGSVSWWLPFGGQYGMTDSYIKLGSYNSLVTLIYTDGHWNLPHSIFD